jgi:acetyl esterase/lipase
VNRTRALLLITAIPLLVVLGVLVAAALGGNDTQGPHPPSTLGTVTSSTASASPASFAAGGERIDVGSGPRGAAIFRPLNARADGPVVVFLHGWLAVDPEHYGPWIAHLVHRGATVIYPAYQQAPFRDTASPLPNILVALRLALERVHVAPGRLVVAGHSAGGALAADYAASARSAGLPEPAAVFSVYPGRSLRGIALRIPAVSARSIAAGTPVLVLAGAGDRVVGSRIARTIVRTATRARARLRIVHDPRVDDHEAPERFGAASRRTFWAPLDRLIAATAA